MKGNYFEDTKKTMDSRASFWDITESEANAFARQLLMPKNLIITEGQKLIKKHGGKMQKDEFINKMASIFEAPVKEMQIRLKHIGII